MIEVTDEMVDAAALAFTNKPTEAVYIHARRMVTAALEAYEANKPKPKPEPVGYALVRHGGDRHGQIYKTFNTKIAAEKHRDLVIFPPDEFLDLHEICTTQPTREPLSAEQLVLLWNGSTKEIPYEHFQAVFRFAEKSHGIGVE